VSRVRSRSLAGETTDETPLAPGKPPSLCTACPYRPVFERRCADTIASSPGDIGCYTLGALPPLEAMDCATRHGASIGVGLGLRHVLPTDEARRVVSVNRRQHICPQRYQRLVEMINNPPATGHVLVILDNAPPP
jgi:indolepyruvate ferredoxin oxidoreductase alpha subunit